MSISETSRKKWKKRNPADGNRASEPLEVRVRQFAPSTAKT